MWMKGKAAAPASRDTEFRGWVPAQGRDDANCLPDRLQPRLDRGAARFEERRQREFFAELVHRLVGGKAGAVGGDLEQDAVGLAEIKAAEIEAVNLAAVGNAEFAQA